MGMWGSEGAPLSEPLGRGATPAPHKKWLLEGRV